MDVFVGFNHHKEVAVFGAALKYDETADSCQWLFEAFLEAHRQKNLITIFTDEDAAMAKALKVAVPVTPHSLCVFHIMQNGIKHLGNTFKESGGLFKHFRECMFEYEDTTEFEEA